MDLVEDAAGDAALAGLISLARRSGDSTDAEASDDHDGEGGEEFHCGWLVSFIDSL